MRSIILNSIFRSPIRPVFPVFGKTFCICPLKFYNFFYLHQFYQFSLELEAIEKRIKEFKY